MQITTEQLKAMLPTCKNPESWASALNEVLDINGISSVQQVAYFIAQCGHESNDFNVLVENLNYSEQALNSVFSKYFGAPPKAEAKLFARQPEKIANLVYANRIGNGSFDSGDGFKFRGRGILQITGKSNYGECSKAIFGDDTLIKNPDLLMQPKYAVMSAAWFWKKNSLKDIEDFNRLTVKINGGTNGSADRVARLAVCLKVLNKK